jgi:hypothetical protein
VVLPPPCPYLYVLPLNLCLHYEVHVPHIELGGCTIVEEDG